MRVLALALVLISLSFAIQMVDPHLMEVNEGDTVDLGIMGPGQTMEVSIHPKVYEGGVHGIGGNYDLAYVTSLPEGWKSTRSKLYGDPLQVTVTAEPLAKEGTYYINIAVEDEGNGELLGVVNFVAKVEISNDVMDAEVSPLEQRVGIAQPATFEITITNRGNAGDVFRVSAEGVPKWSFTKTIYVSGKGSKKLLYEVAAHEEEKYEPSIVVESASSSLVKKSMPVEIYVYPDVFSDYKAISNGALLFPIVEAPVYALMGLLSNLW